jgi:hypothetical protein
VKGYGKYANEEIKKLTEENKKLLKENVILYGKLEKLLAQLERDKINKKKERTIYSDCE